MQKHISTKKLFLVLAAAVILGFMAKNAYENHKLTTTLQTKLP